MTKQRAEADALLDVSLIDGLSGMTNKDKIATIKKEYIQAKKLCIKYGNLKKELRTYTLELPQDPDITDFSGVKKTYYVATSAFSRISNIEANGIANQDRWRGVRFHLEEYIAERSSDLLINGGVLDEYPNAKSQEAAVRDKLKDPYKMLAVVKNKEQTAIAFTKIVNAKKRDIDKFITNLSRQMKVVSMELNQTR